MIFTFQMGGRGVFFLVEETSNIEQFAEQNSLTIFILCIMIILLTSGFLSFLLSRNIVKPIKALQESTRQIKEGNLDYALRKDRNDEIGELMADFEDMRQKLKRSEELQLQYEQDRKLLISNISHDLKTPISSIKGYVQGIQEGIAFSEERKNKYLTTIYRRAHEMDVLINELFLFSTLDLKQEKFHFQRINLTAFLQDCIDDFQHVFEKQGIELEGLPLNESDLHVMADREKLTRVMNNLFQNSMKFMDNSEGKISLHLQRKGDAVLIAVEDNGPGIPKEEVGQIFETFYQVDASRTKTRTGSGLGLAIAKQIINEHKGEIWAESKEGKGTKIIIQLPLDDSEERGQ
ncbi:MAG: HAMP domain-containing histidine kinase [Bacillus sp. (in: Bacteria)]|nr:HAMP domain-containing histidine kinase [Bacillus sp. (in: firmicutes)]